jgi:uncharacterized protein YgiM (DUF1202 family)
MPSFVKLNVIMGKKIAAIVFAISFVSLTFFILWHYLKPVKAEIEIKSYPQASVYINGQEVGKTPYQDRNFKPGVTEIRLVADGVNTQWERQMSIPPQTSVIISRTLSDDAAKTEGHILYFEDSGKDNIAGLIINSIPQGASIVIDGEMKGETPLTLNDLSPGEHKITASLPSYKSKEIITNAIAGYKLVAEMSLSRDVELSDDSEDQEEEQEEDQAMIEILDTPTGWLRVREDASTSSKELGKVDPGEEFVLVDEKSGWYKIEFEDGEGWISSTYAEKVGEDSPTPTPTTQEDSDSDSQENMEEEI